MGYGTTRTRTRDPRLPCSWRAASPKVGWSAATGSRGCSGAPPEPLPVLAFRLFGDIDLAALANPGGRCGRAGAGPGPGPFARTVTALLFLNGGVRAAWCSRWCLSAGRGRTGALTPRRHPAAEAPTCEASGSRRAAPRLSSVSPQAGVPGVVAVVAMLAVATIRGTTYFMRAALRRRKWEPPHRRRARPGDHRSPDPAPARRHPAAPTEGTLVSALLTIQGLTRHFPGASAPTVDGLDLDVPAGSKRRRVDGARRRPPAPPGAWACPRGGTRAMRRA